MNDKNCFGYVYFRANKISPERFVPSKSAIELLSDFKNVNSLELAMAIAFIYLGSSESRPDQKRFITKHIVWVEEDKKTISHRPDTNLAITSFDITLLETIFSEYYSSDVYRVKYLSL